MPGEQDGNAVHVSGVPGGVEDKHIQAYFLKKKNGGCGDVLEVVHPLDGKKDCAAVYFKNTAAVESVLLAHENGTASDLQGAKLQVVRLSAALKDHVKDDIFTNVRAVPKDDKVWSIIENIGLGKRLGLTIEKYAVNGDWHQITQARTELSQQLASSKGHEPKQEPVTFKGGEDLGEFDSCLLLYARLMTDGNYGLGGPWVREETHQPGGNANVFLSSRAPNDAEENFHGAVKHYKRSSTHERIGGLERYCKGKVRRAVETVSRRAPDLAILVVDHSIAVRGTQTAIDRELGNIETELDIESCPRHCDVCGTGRPKPARNEVQGAHGGARPKVKAESNDARSEGLLRTYLADSSTKKKALSNGKLIYCYRVDICKLPVDVIVNAANAKLEHGGGVADAINKAAGRQLQIESRDYVKRHGPLGLGQTAVTDSYRLPCKLVVHTVGPDCKNRMRKERLQCKLELHVAVLAALETAELEGAKHVALPAISSGIYGMPLDTSCATISEAVVFYLERRALGLEQVHLVDINDAAPGHFFKHLKQPSGSHTPVAVAWALMKQFNGKMVTKDAAKDGVAEIEEMEAGFERAQGSSPRRDSNYARKDSYKQPEDNFTDDERGAGNSDVDMRSSQQGKTGSKGNTKRDSKLNAEARGGKGNFEDSLHGAAAGDSGEGEKRQCAFCDEEAFAQVLDCPHLLCLDCCGYAKKHERCPACVHTTAQARQANKLEMTVKGKTPRSPVKAEGKDGKATIDEKQKEEEEEEPECCICLSSGADVVNLKKLDKCKHTFCTPCIENWFKQKPVCPVCKTQYGCVTGNMPHGTMTVNTHRHMSCPGYDGQGAIVIDYNIPSAVQDKNHPTPGAYFSGTKRTAYLPDTPEGRRVLRKLRTAFDRKLTFTVGRSVTTGMDDCVVWNNIHHKTSLAGGAFGYPDPDYLFRVEDELKAIGVDD